MEMMKGMKPEDLQRMQQMAGSMGAGGPGGPSEKPDIGAMLRNPEMMQQSMQMMRGMSEDDLTQMLKGSQPGLDEAKARKCAAAVAWSIIDISRSDSCIDSCVTQLMQLPSLTGSSFTLLGRLLPRTLLLHAVLDMHHSE